MPLYKNIIIYGSINAIKSFIPFFLLPILTTYLSPEEYGLLSLVEVTVLMLLPFILLNIHGAAKVEYFKLQTNEFREYISTTLILSLFSFGCLMLLATLFQSDLSKLIGIPSYIILLLPIFAASRVIATLILTLFQVMDKAYQFMWFTILQTLIDLSLSLFLVTQLYLGFIGRLEGIYISFMLASLIGIFLLKKMDLLGKINITRYMSQILHFGIPLIPHALGAVIINMSDRYFIAYFIGEEQVGIYTVSYQVAALMLLIGMSINQAWSPFLFKLLSQNNEKNFLKITSYTRHIILFFLISLAFIYGGSDILFSIFVDQKYLSAQNYFPFLLLSFFFQSLYFIFVNFLFYEKKTYLVAGFTIFSALLNIVLNYVLIQYYGTFGVAYATLATWIVYFFLISFYVGRRWYPRLRRSTQ